MSRYLHMTYSKNVTLSTYDVISQVMTELPSAIPFCGYRGGACRCILRKPDR